MGRRLALLIATYEYQDTGLRRLTSPAHDAEALAAVLGDSRIAGFEVTTLINEPLQRVGQAIGDFYRDRRRDDLTLLYFTGHGLKDDDGRLYLAMTNTLRDNLLFTGLRAEQVDQAMESCASRQKVLVLDCCYSGAFPAGRIAKADTAVHALERFQGRGRTVLTASDATQYSFEGNQPHGQAAQSVFTRYLVAGLRDGSADLDGDGDITLDELYSYVHDRVMEEMPQQRPKKQDNVEGRTIVARNINWTLPTYLRNAIGSPIASDRLAALDGLTHLHRIGNDHVRATVETELRRLTEDDSRSVSTAAVNALRPNQGDEPESRTEPPTEPEPTEPEPPPAERGAIAGVLELLPDTPQLPTQPRVKVYVALVVVLLMLAAVAVAVVLTTGSNQPTGSGERGSLGPSPSAWPDVRLTGFEGVVDSLVFSPDGRTVAVSSVVGGNHFTLKLFDMATGQLTTTFRDVRETSFNPDNKTVAISDSQGAAQLWDREKATFIAKLPIDNHGSNIVLAFSPDGKLLATASGCECIDPIDYPIQLWDGHTGQHMGAFSGAKSGVSGMEFSRDGTKFVAGIANNSAVVWEVATRKTILSIKEVGHTVVFSPDGKTFAASGGAADEPVQLFDVVNGRVAGTDFGPGAPFAYTPRGLATVNEGEGKVRLWNTSTKEVIATFTPSVAFSPDGVVVASTVSTNSVELLWLDTGRKVTLPAHGGPVTALAFSKDGKMVASGSLDQTVWLRTI